MPTFALIGAAGYIAPRHMQAITDLGGIIVAATDPSDSVGVLDRYAPDAEFYRDPERFFAALHWLRPDYAVVCSPNYLHLAHTTLALRAGCDAICEKPLVMNRSEYHELLDVQTETGRDVFPVLQLRHHPDVSDLRGAKESGLRDVVIDYQTRRGPWYDESWKASVRKSGGLVLNLGIHLIDLCCYLFGPIGSVYDVEIDERCARGTHHHGNAVVNWVLSSTSKDEPRRVFRVDDAEVDLSNRMAQLHLELYRAVLAGTATRAASVAATVEGADAILKSAVSR